MTAESAAQMTLMTYTMRIPLLFLLVTNVSANATEHPTAKSPWQWTVEERINARMDPSSIAERRNNYLKKAARHGDNEDTAVSKLAYIIDGSDTPELILPTELWQFLMSTAFDPDVDASTHWRKVYADRAAGILLPQDFWGRVAIHVATYRKTGEPLAAARQKRDRPALEKAWRERCHALVDSLHSAQTEFEDELFLRFLYQAVAKGLTISDYKAADPQKVRSEEAGCP